MKKKKKIKSSKKRKEKGKKEKNDKGKEKKKEEVKSELEKTIEKSINNGILIKDTPKNIPPPILKREEKFNAVESVSLPKSKENEKNINYIITSDNGKEYEEKRYFEFKIAKPKENLEGIREHELESQKFSENQSFFEKVNFEVKKLKEKDLGKKFFEKNYAEYKFENKKYKL